MNNKSKNYYGIAGMNGCGVYDDYNHALEQNRYLKNFKIKKFGSFKDAKEWAEENYYDLQPMEVVFANIEPIEKCNWTNYRRKSGR